MTALTPGVVPTPLTGVRDGFGVSSGREWPSGRQFAEIGSLVTESGAVLTDVTMCFESWGRLNQGGDNAVLVLHALTGDSHVVGPVGPDQPTPGWWDGLIGPGAPLDNDRYFVIAANVLGGCRGTTGPSSIGPDGKPYGSRFPQLTTRDQVTAEAVLARPARDQLALPPSSAARWAACERWSGA